MESSFCLLSCTLSTLNDQKKKKTANDFEPHFWAALEILAVGMMGICVHFIKNFSKFLYWPTPWYQNVFGFVCLFLKGKIWVLYLVLKNLVSWISVKIKLYYS